MGMPDAVSRPITLEIMPTFAFAWVFGA